MGIVDDAVSWVKSMMSKLKSDGSGLFSVRTLRDQHYNIMYPPDTSGPMQSGPIRQQSCMRCLW